MISSLDAHLYLRDTMRACSHKAGWRSLLLRAYEDPPDVEPFTTAATADHLIVLVTEGACNVEGLYRGGWQKAVYGAGTIGMTAPGEQVTLQWHGTTRHSTLQLHIPAETIRSCAEESVGVSSYAPLSTTYPAKTPQGAEMRRKPSDPVEREQLRAETREQVRSMHPELAQVLGLDAELESKLIDVLSDQQTAHLDRFYSEWPESPAPYSSTSRDPMEQVRQLADQETRSKQQVRDVLGEERFVRYLSYTDTLRERCAADYFNAHLNEEGRAVKTSAVT